MLKEILGFISFELRKRVNKLGRDIKKRLKQLECDNADRLAEEITSTDNSRVMFEAVRTLCKVRENKPIIVHNTHGNPVGTDKGKAAVIREWYGGIVQIPHLLLLKALPDH